MKEWMQLLHMLLTSFFLDIEMPRKNGFDFMAQFPEPSFDVIFTTAYDQFAIKAFKFSALDYLLKPVNIKELQAAVQKAAQRIQFKNISQKLDNLFYNLNAAKPSNQKIALPTLEGLIFVNIRELVWLEARGSYTCVYLSSQQRIMVSRTLKEFEDVLPGLP